MVKEAQKVGDVQVGRQVLVGGRIWNGERLVNGSIAIEDGHIAAVHFAAGPPAEGATVIDLDGAAVFPGFVDAHAHPLIGGVELTGVQLRQARDVQEAVAAVASFAAEHPELPWIVGEGFDLSIDRQASYFARDLDAVVADRPVALRSSDIHTMWCNTAALNAAGITTATPEPRDGVIERDAEGRPTGTLREWGAFLPVLRALPRRTTDDTAQALMRGLQTLRASGVTSVQDAWVELDDVPSYLQAARAGLPVRLNLAFRADPDNWRAELDRFVAARLEIETAGIELLRADTVKFFADGIIEGGTAHVKEPYHGTSCCGLPAWPAGELREAAAAFDRLGFQLHIHAIGDAAVEAAVEAIVNAENVNGPRDRRPVIAHAQLVDGPEIAAMRAHDITVAIQPYWAKLDSVVRYLTNDRLQGPRAEAQYPFRTLADSGVRIASSSDYPITTPSPLEAIGVAISRDECGDDTRGWLPAERLDLALAVRAATEGAAYTQFADHDRGRIAPGFLADLTVVSGLSDHPTAAELISARVTATWLAGHQHPAATAEAATVRRGEA